MPNTKKENTMKSWLTKQDTILRYESSQKLQPRCYFCQIKTKLRMIFCVWYVDWGYRNKVHIFDNNIQHHVYQFYALWSFSFCNTRIQQNGLNWHTNKRLRVAQIKTSRSIVLFLPSQTNSSCLGKNWTGKHKKQWPISAASLTPTQFQLFNDEYAYYIPNPEHMPKYTKAKVPHTQDKHTQLSSFTELCC